MKRLLREPLVHFLAIGAVLFALYQLVGPSESTERIVMDRAEVEAMRATWHMQWQRDPTAEELNSLIDARIREEVLYREALAMGLDHNDAIVRRRLAQKMQFLTQDISELHPPTEEELIAYHAAHAQDYRSEKRWTFKQVTYSPDKRIDAYNDAAEVLHLGYEPVGDRTGVTTEFTAANEATILRELGDAFVAALDSVAADGHWHGPFRSSMGIHLVNVSAVHPSLPLPYDEVAQQVREDYIHHRQEELNQRLVDELLKKYDMLIDTTDASLGQDR